jgi:hypothetical protein
MNSTTPSSHSAATTSTSTTLPNPVEPTFPIPSSSVTIPSSYLKSRRSCIRAHFSSICLSPDYYSSQDILPYCDASSPSSDPHICRNTPSTSAQDISGRFISLFDHHPHNLPYLVDFWLHSAHILTSSLPPVMDNVHPLVSGESAFLFRLLLEYRHSFNLHPATLGNHSLQLDALHPHFHSPTPEGHGGLVECELILRVHFHQTATDPLYTLYPTAYNFVFYVCSCHHADYDHCPALYASSLLYHLLSGLYSFLLDDLYSLTDPLRRDVPVLRRLYNNSNFPVPVAWYQYWSHPRLQQYLSHFSTTSSPQTPLAPPPPPVDTVRPPTIRMPISSDTQVSIIPTTLSPPVSSSPLVIRSSRHVRDSQETTLSSPDIGTADSPMVISDTDIDSPDLTAAEDDTSFSY